MFGDYDALGGEEVGGVEIFEDCDAAVIVVGRVEENEVGDEVAGG